MNPSVIEVKARLVVREMELLSTWDVQVPSYQLLRNQGAHATVWTIDFGRRVPCSQLTLSIEGQSFYRPFQVETADDPQDPQLVASGYLSRRTGEPLTDPNIAWYGAVSNNLAYRPPLLPFTERLSWLIYLVLIGSTLALGWILFSLAKTIMRSEPTTAAEGKSDKL